MSAVPYIRTRSTMGMDRICNFEAPSPLNFMLNCLQSALKILHGRWGKTTKKNAAQIQAWRGLSLTLDLALTPCSLPPFFRSLFNQGLDPSSRKVYFDPGPIK